MLFHNDHSEQTVYKLSVYNKLWYLFELLGISWITFFSFMVLNLKVT